MAYLQAKMQGVNALLNLPGSFRANRTDAAIWCDKPLNPELARLHNYKTSSCSQFGISQKR